MVSKELQKCTDPVTEYPYIIFQIHWLLSITPNPSLENSKYNPHLCTYLHPWSRVLLEKLTGSTLVRSSPHFMEPAGSLPNSQVPVTCPYQEPDRSSPCPHIPLPEYPSQYYHPICAWVLQVVSFPQMSPPKPNIHLYFPPYMLHVLPATFFSFWSPERYWVRSTDC